MWKLRSPGACRTTRDFSSKSKEVVSKIAKISTPYNVQCRLRPIYQPQRSEYEWIFQNVMTKVKKDIYERVN